MAWAHLVGASQEEKVNSPGCEVSNRTPGVPQAYDYSRTTVLPSGAPRLKNDLKTLTSAYEEMRTENSKRRELQSREGDIAWSVNTVSLSVRETFPLRYTRAKESLRATTCKGRRGRG